MKEEIKTKAINLRREGLSYSEILKKIPVAKSTLSLWLRSVNLTKRQNQRLTEKKLLAIKKGGQSRKNWRLLNTQQIKEQAFLEAKKKIKKIDARDLWLMGIMLYWAEGSKEKEYKINLQEVESPIYKIPSWLILISLGGVGNFNTYLITDGNDFILIDWHTFPT